jgi:hypothetical protein
MPASLMDMLGGNAPLQFSPRDYAGNQIGMGDAIAQNSNSLVGLGMGLLQPYRPGESPYAAALQGFQAGSVADSRRGYQQAQLQHQKRQEARQAANDAFTRSQAGITDAQRAMKDVLGADATPEQKADFMKSFYASKTDPGGWILKDIIDPNDPDGERKITVQEHNRTGQIRPPQLPGQTGTAPAGADPFTAGGTAGVYGYGGGFTPPGAGGAQPAGPPAQGRGITLPSGEVVTPPPGLSKKGREAWQNHIATTSADMASGKMTEAQAKYSIYATGMEIAQRELEGSSHLGTSAEGKGLGGLPWGVGAYFQSNAYQNYRNAKDAWLNAKLRAESGATINPDEFARDDRIYFPQPGEGPEQVAAKARLREQITKNMTKAGGPGYTSPPPLAPPNTPTASGAAPTQPPPTAGRGGSAPPRPANVPAGSAYSPSRNQWKLPDGTIVDAAGKPI